MKLKYYLRGVGIGIIFATLVMTVSSFVHKYNITDEYIIKEARKLGMVMKDELDDSESIWGKNETEDTQVMGSETNSSESESASESTTPSETPTPSESESESQTPPVSEEKTYVTVTIARGDYARQVAEKVYAAGLVEDAEEFRKYIGEHGYGQSFHAGTYSIPMGANYEEICKILTSR